MQLALFGLSLVAVAYAVPAILSEERITAILEKLRRAQSIGELAVNTPTGIYPIKDINRSNLRQIFNFAPLAPKESEIEVLDAKQGQDAHSSKPEKPATVKTSQPEASTAATGEPASTSAETAVTEEKAGASATKESEPAGEAAVPTGNEVTEEATTSAYVTSTGEEEKKGVDETTSEPRKETDVTDPATDTPPTAAVEEAEFATEKVPVKEPSEASSYAKVTDGKPAAPEVATKKEEVEGSGDEEGSSGTSEDTASSASDSTPLLTGNGSDAAGSANESPSPAGNEKADKYPTNPLPVITLPQSPDVPYVFFPVQSYKGQELPGISYLLIPKKYESKVPDYLTAKKA